MTKQVTDILRRQRREALRHSEQCDKQADMMEREAVNLRKAATEQRYFHCQLGAAIQQLEGDDAVLDMPADAL